MQSQHHLLVYQYHMLSRPQPPTALAVQAAGTCIEAWQVASITAKHVQGHAAHNGRMQTTVLGKDREQMSECPTLVRAAN